MSTVVLHAGMPKAGSSSIQAWLRTNDAALRDVGWHVVVYRREVTGGEVSFQPAAGGGVNSATVVRHYNKSGRDPRVLDQFFGPLDALARRLGKVIVTGEGFARLFAEADQPFMDHLAALSATHEVRVAYYVRAQHEAIEAAWRQWGFRQSWQPRGYVELRARLLDYVETRDAVARHLPRVAFGVRPFHREALRDTDVVADFVDTFLQPGLAGGSTAVWANPGLPLELVNVLREAEPGRFWTSAHDNVTIRPLKALAARWKLPDTDEVRRSRLVLQHYCHDRFEVGNQRLIRELGWPIDHLVPPPDQADATEECSLAELNDLWASHMSAAERELLFVAIEQLLAATARGRSKQRRRSTGPRPVSSAAASPVQSADPASQPSSGRQRRGPVGTTKLLAERAVSAVRRSARRP